MRICDKVLSIVSAEEVSPLDLVDPIKYAQKNPDKLFKSLKEVNSVLFSYAAYHILGWNNTKISEVLMKLMERKYPKLIYNECEHDRVAYIIDTEKDKLSPKYPARVRLVNRSFQGRLDRYAKRRKDAFAVEFSKPKEERAGWMTKYLENPKLPEGLFIIDQESRLCH